MAKNFRVKLENGKTVKIRVKKESGGWFSSDKYEIYEVEEGILGDSENKIGEVKSLDGLREMLSAYYGKIEKFEIYD